MVPLLSDGLSIDGSSAVRPAAVRDRAETLRAEFERRSNITPAMLHSVNEKGILISVSDAWLAKLGYAREEVIGRPSSAFLTPESRERAIREALPAFFRSGRSDNVEYQMVCKNGAVIDVLLSAVLDPGSAGDGPVSLAVITDVTALKAAERRLAEGEARYRGLVEDQSELVSLASPGGDLRFVNHAYARHYNLEPPDMVGRNLFDLIPPDARAAVAENFKTVCRAGGAIQVRNQVMTADGTTRWMAWTNRAVTDAQGRVVAIHSIGRDIHDRVVAEERLRESEARYRMLAEHSSDMVFQLDLALVRTYVSPSCREILGYEPHELIGIKPANMAHPDDAERVTKVLQSLLNGEVAPRSVINRIRHRDGRWIWVEAGLRVLKNPETGAPAGIIGPLRDISARKDVEDRLAEANRRLEALAAEDALTGLQNRRSFDAALAREYRRARRNCKSLGLLMIDADWFKPYNDYYGHPAGDECLRQIGRAIFSQIRRPADIAARYGGEEFAVLLPDTDEPGAATIAALIRRAVQELEIEHLASPNRLVTVSIGAAAVASFHDPVGPQRLLGEADRALYRAKDSGRNNVVVASTL